MNTINIAADATAQRIGIGNQYENEATAVVFDCSQFAEDHGAGTAQIIHRRPTESIGYVCTNVTQTNNSVTWLVTDDDTSFTGKGQVQLRWYVNDVLRESVIFPTYILPSVASSDDAPAEVKSALEQLMEWVNDNTISIEDLDERIANYFDEHPIPTPVTSVNEKLGDVVLTAEDVGAYSTEEADEKFCVPDGEYEELNAGTAKQLLSDSYTLDQVPYLYRKSPDSDRAVEEIVGGTVGWNQLFNTSGSSQVEKNGIALTKHEDGLITVSGTAAANAPFHICFVEVSNNHAYYLRGCPAGGGNSIYALYINNLSVQPFDTGSGSITKQTASGTGSVYIIVYEGQTVNLTFKPQFTDLTTMFGSTIADYIYSLETATAGAGVAKLKEWGFFTEDYYEYCEPTLRSVEGLVSKKTVGFNQWDEEWEVGTISGGGEASSSVTLRSKNYIPVLEGETYYFQGPNNKQKFIFCYGADKAYINQNISVSVPSTFTIPTGCHYIRIVYTYYIQDYTTYNHDICINLSDPTKNGQYEPYESHSYPLDSSVVLRGIPKLDSNNNLYFDGDIYPADGNGSRKYGLVDLGELNWSYESYVFRLNSNIGAKNETNMYAIANIICPKYPTVSQATMGLQGTDKVIAGLNWSNGIRVCDSAYTDATTFKTAMSGVMLLYELATPTTFTAQPYHNPQIVGDTEEFVTTGIVPVGHATKYYQNLRKKIENLPWNFSSLIAPTEVTNKATRNYTTGSYLILNNVLYKVTSNIANGGTITPSTNCTATTIMAEFMSL